MSKPVSLEQPIALAARELPLWCFPDALFLAGLVQYDVEVVVTLELSVQFLSLARVSSGLSFHAEVVRSAKNFCFVKGALLGDKDGSSMAFALASGMVALAGAQRNAP